MNSHCNECGRQYGNDFKCPFCYPPRSLYLIASEQKAMSISFRKEQIIVNQWAAILRTLKADIADDYRCTDDPADTLPGMLVTFGLSADGSWHYQTGDNSFTGGAYGHAYWGLAFLHRRSNCKKLAQEAFDEAVDQVGITEI